MKRERVERCCVTGNLISHTQFAIKLFTSETKGRVQKKIQQTFTLINLI